MIKVNFPYHIIIVSYLTGFYLYRIRLIFLPGISLRKTEVKYYMTKGTESIRCLWSHSEILSLSGTTKVLFL